MPELPEVQTVIDDLEPNIKNRKIVDIRILTRSIWRYKYPRKTNICGATVTDIGRKGKYILTYLSSDHILITHLGMTGRLVLTERGKPPDKHTHVVIQFDDFDIHFNDVRRFGFMDLCRGRGIYNVSYLAKLGPDPFELSEDEFAGIIKSKNRMIKQLLLDQNVISGLGNIYSDEILFGSRIHPRRTSSRLSKKRILRLYDVTIEILNGAIKARGSSVSDFVDGSGAPGGYQNFHSVYGREGKPCRNCGADIKREIIASRSAHFCPRCQR